MTDYRRWMVPTGFVFLFTFTLGAQCKKKNTPPNTPLSHVLFAQSHSFDAASIDEVLSEMTAEPHPFGSERQSILADFLLSKANSYQWLSLKDPFTSTVPNPTATRENDSQAVSLTKTGANIFTRITNTSSCIILLGSHYDSKRLDTESYLGANDSASSSAALFWILDALKQYADKESLDCDFAGIWFDGEEAYLNNWNDGLLEHPLAQIDNTYGSRHFVNQLIACDDKKPHCLQTKFGGGQIKALILLDLIGSPNIQLTPDLNSSPKLISLAKELESELFGSAKLFANKPASPIQDDHIPFRKKGIAAINLIDFENIDHWHRPTDTLETISVESIEKASRLAIALALTLSKGS